METQRILIVDDEENIRETMRFALEAVGYAVETAADGREGLEKFGTGEGWDLVLLDQRMPGMEGIDVLRTIRERDPGARVVMVTAYGTIELAVDAMKLGAVDFLRKPFTPETLRGAVQVALAHPRLPVAPGDPSLTTLLPADPGASRRPQVPYIHFRTLNGFRFWPAPLPPGGEETEALRIRRAFEVEAPSSERRRCAVDLTTAVRELVRNQTGHDFPPADAFWDTVAKSGLSNYLWQNAALPGDVLSVYELNREQVELVRRLAGRSGVRR